jgi:catechol 2,3-dioxygenase-like lactoylglutathione lyase family enzyme
MVMAFTREQVPQLPCAVTGGVGAGSEPDLWLRPTEGGPLAPTHIALHCATRAEVDVFHAAALAARARDHGPPGQRSHDHPNDDGAFVLDPDGYNLEAVCHGGVSRVTPRASAPARRGSRRA